MSEEETNIVATVATVGVVGVGVALFEAALLPGLVLGVAAVAAPKFAPKIGSALGPMFKSTVRGVYKLGQKTKEFVAETNEHVQDIVAEVDAETKGKPASGQGHGAGSLTIMQNVSTENSALSEDAPPLAARHDDIQNESQAAKRAADETSAPVAPKGHKKKKKVKHVLRMEHQTLGRVRMKFSSAKGNPELLDEIGKKFAGIVGVESCEVNPITGSVVLLYDKRRHDDFHDHLSRHCAEHHGGATPRPPGTQLDDITKKIEDEAEFLAEHSHAAKKRRAHLQIYRSSRQAGDQ